ncbi:hypothetical protein INS49_008803 [Diaporthe citri]|uniref:uncharacterized protein n=1 Tax=Diaporthe citri TaxID=83186 RepID=UPI001C7EF9A0|nr:uncharacterized protein INS49_008803 [Diaporthe citri]KAG6363702.1 hypothetical protein INS49_008803 [Diaporthe citri]
MQELIVRNIIELWLLSFFGLCFLAVRIWVRTKMVGIKGYDLDDWLLIGVVCLWCSGPVLSHIFTARCKGRHTSDLTYEQRKAMPHSEYHEWEYGSKIYLVGLSEYFVIIWMLKFNMLCFYQRVVRNTWSEKFVKPLMGIIGVTLMVIVFTISLTCRPFHNLWKVWPDPGPRCVPQNVVFLATILSFNLTTDLCIMLVPLPIFIRLRTTMWKRLGLFFCFTLGTLCMTAAVLRYVLIFHLNESTMAGMWSTREDFVAVVVGQAPMLTPLFRRSFWVEAGYATDKSSSPLNGRRHSADKNGYELNDEVRAVVTVGGSPQNRRTARNPYSITQTEKGESQEEIITNNAADAQKVSDAADSATEPQDIGREGYHDGAGIMVERTVNISQSVREAVRNEFPPERWEGRRRGWESTPFSGGPQEYSMSQLSFAVAKMAQHYDQIRPSPGSDNQKRSWMTVLTPGAGVKVRLHVAMAAE